MNFEYTPKVKELRARVQAFIDEHIYPIEDEYFHWVHNPANYWKVHPAIEPLKEKAKVVELYPCSL